MAGEGRLGGRAPLLAGEVKKRRGRRCGAAWRLDSGGKADVVRKTWPEGSRGGGEVGRQADDGERCGGPGGMERSGGAEVRQ